jgi:hypothetical protein
MRLSALFDHTGTLLNSTSCCAGRYTTKEKSLAKEPGLTALHPLYDREYCSAWSARMSWERECVRGEGGVKGEGNRPSEEAGKVLRCDQDSNRLGERRVGVVTNAPEIC